MVTAFDLPQGAKRGKGVSGGTVEFNSYSFHASRASLTREVLNEVCRDDFGCEVVVVD